MTCGGCGRKFPGGDSTKPGSDRCPACLLFEDVSAEDLARGIAAARRFDPAPMISRSLMRHSSSTGADRRRRAKPNRR